MHHRLLAVLAAALPATAQDMITASWSGTVYEVDTFHGTSTPLGPGLFGQTCLARDENGTLWSTHRDAAYAIWLTNIDPATGLATIVWPLPDLLRGLAADGAGHLYGIRPGHQDQLVRVDTATGQLTFVGWPPSYITSMVFADGALYAWDSVYHRLLTLDPSSGFGTPVQSFAWNLGAEIAWIARRADGRLIGGDTSLYTINAATGWALPIGGTFASTRGGAPHQAFTTTIGTGCAGTAGLVTSSAVLTSGPAATLTLQSTNHAANAPGLVVFDLFASGGPPSPLSLDPMLGTQGCSLLVRPDVTMFAVTSATAPATLRLQLPVMSSWGGYSLLAQHAVLEGVPGGLSLSDATVVQFGF
ncbi:MAG: hypothetical protein KDC48_02535 [Planctomycetes bacterium]|nr:hypothetical protein [Planctomycetota bacterium]